ncbi:MAG: thioredoxin family protein [Campylobacterota bacterium]|nr:thioredoxin family protein [Campylobacterota bacterium]
MITTNIESVNDTINNNLAVAIYFSAPTCNVCHALKPKLFSAINENFENFEIVDIDISISKEIASNFSVFAIPTLLVFLDSKEFLRKSRHMSVDDLIAQIKRPYEIMCK